MMKRIVSIMILSALLSAGALTAFASIDQWKINFTLTSPLPITNGSFTIGVPEQGSWSDYKVPYVSLGSFIEIAELRYDQPDYLYSADYRRPFSEGTQVWSNIHIRANYGFSEFGLPPMESRYGTLSWAPGTGADALPAGAVCKMIVKWMSSDLGTKEYDLTTPGSQYFTAPDSNASRITIYVKMPGGVEPSKTQQIPYLSYSPILDENSDAYYGGMVYYDGNMHTHICKTSTVYGQPEPARLYPRLDTSTKTNEIKGRLALYGNFVYGVTGNRAVVKRRTDGLSSDSFTVYVDANADTVPAVTGNGDIYVGCGNFLKKLNSSGTVIGTSPDLGGTVGSPAIPGTDQVWVNAGSKLFRLSSDLSSILADADVSGTAGVPMVNISQGKVFTTAGNQLYRLNMSSFGSTTTYTAGGLISSTPYMHHANGNILFMADDHKLYKIDSATMSEVVPPIAYGGTGAITGSPVVGANWTGIAGGADRTVYLLNNQTGAATIIGCNQSTYGCVADVEGHLYFVSSEGTLFTLE